MKIAACILSGGDREDLILDAARSVEHWVDTFLCIDTGPSAQQAICRMLKKYGGRVEVVKTDQDPYWSCCGGRNQCLTEATERGFDWALILDTDMRVESVGADVRGFLSETDSPVVWFATGGTWQGKPLLFRLPACGVWRDDPHEWFDGLPGPEITVPGCCCWEVPKTPEQLAERGRAVLAQLTDGRPETPRTVWYIAAAYSELGGIESAIQHWIRCAPMCSPDWAANCWWSIAELLYRNRQYERALEFCNAGRSPDYPEFDWLAGICLIHTGEPGLAKIRAREAEHSASKLRDTPRVGSWSYKQAWYEGPADVLYWAEWKLGNDEAAKDAEVRREILMAERLAAC